MKSLRELLAYYEGCQMDAYATSERRFGSGHGTVLIEDNTRIIDSAILYDADRLAKASLASFLTCSHLRTGGHWTWGKISLYYARFHIMSALIRLVGIVPIGGWVLIRTDEELRQYQRVKKTAPEAKDIGCGGGSHKEIWHIFSRYFGDWSEEEAPNETASCLREEDDGTALYEMPVEARNEANYLQSNAGVFFPETDFSGLQQYFLEQSELIGNWNWFRTDATPNESEYPPEAWFFEEMMAWNLIKFVILALVESQGQRLLEDYTWMIDNLAANPELKQLMRNDLLGVCNDY